MCKHYRFLLTEKNRHYVNAPEYDNCVLCLAEKGPLTQAEVANYLGLSKMRVCQIEQAARQKLEKRLKKILN